MNFNRSKIFIFLSLLISLTSYDVKAHPFIDSLKILIPNILSPYPVKLVAFMTLPNGNGRLTDTYIKIKGDRITVEAKYTWGVTTALSHSIDTINIENLASGKYKLYFIMRDSMEPLEDWDNDSISFTYSAIKASVNSKSFNRLINIYPNPVHSAATVVFTKQLLNDVFDVRIFDMTGQEVWQMTGIKEEELTINTEGFEKGIYLIQIHCDGKVFINRKIIIK